MHERAWVPVGRVLVTESRIFLHPLMLIQLTAATFDEQLTRAVGWTMDSAIKKLDSRIEIMEEQS